MDHHHQHQAVFQTNKRKKKLNSELNFADISRKFNENQKLKKEKKIYRLNRNVMLVCECV